MLQGITYQSTYAFACQLYGRFPVERGVDVSAEATR